MRIVLLGPPGAGKGSLASLCAERLGLAHLSTGDIFRQEIAHGTGLGRRVQLYVTTGRLVPDALVVRVMAKRLTPPRLRRGLVLDGFPRTRGQAVGLDRELAHRRAPLHGAVYLAVPTTVLVRRLSGRRVCPRCGAIYHVRTMRPRRPNRCDRCASRLTVRKDDQPATIRRRLVLDRQESAPLLGYYRRRRALRELDGRGHIGRVFERALVLFRRQGWLRRG